MSARKTAARKDRARDVPDESSTLETKSTGRNHREVGNANRPALSNLSPVSVTRCPGKWDVLFAPGCLKTHLQDSQPDTPPGTAIRVIFSAALPRLPWFFSFSPGIPAETQASHGRTAAPRFHPQQQATTVGLTRRLLNGRRFVLSGFRTSRTNTAASPRIPSEPPA